MRSRKALISAAALMLGTVPVLAYQKIDFEQPVSLTIEHYPVDDVQFSVYKIANITEDIQFSLIDPYANAGLELNEEDYGESAQTFATYVSVEKITADGQAVTVEGNAVFTELETGLYLVCANDITVEKTVYKATPSLVALPSSVNGNEWFYDVVMTPKYITEEITYDEREYSVVKHWIDSNKDKRPGEIEVVIMKNNETVETVTLNSGNNWCYKWKAEDDGSTWSVMEKNVPKDYKVNVTGSRTEFVINNTYTGGNPPGSPPTGDTQNLLLPILLMIGAGVLILFSGVMSSRKK